jgi:hypothetical protein
MIFKQGDPQWGHLPLGYGPATIAEAGCLLTTFAQVLRHYGYSVSPLTLNQTLKDAGRWVQGDLLADGAISGLFDGVALVTKWDFTNRPADLSVLTNNATDEYVIEIDFDHNPNDGIQTHFVRFVSWDGQKLIIDDPEYGSEENFADHYGNDLATTILKIVKYTGPAASVAEPPAQVAPLTPFAGSFEPLTGTAHVNSPSNVRTGPSVNYPTNDAHTAGAKLPIGDDFTVTGQITSTEPGGDPYSDGRNKWVRSQYGNWIWEGNLTLNVQAANGGSTEQAAPAEPAAPAADADQKQPDSAEGELVMLGYSAWLKPASNETTIKHEGAPVINLDTNEPIEVVPMETRVPFVGHKSVSGVNYFVTQHMLDNKLNHGIDGLNLQMAVQPGNVLTADEAAKIEPETARADTETTVATETPTVGKVWTSLFSFLDKHHPNNKE